MTPPSILQQVRDLPLDQILTHFGLPSKREGSTVRFKNDQFNIVVSGHGLWFDNAASLGGRGAIDLLLHVKCGTNPRTAGDLKVREAIAWLADFQPSAGTTSIVPSSPAPRKESFAQQSARLAIRDEARWPLVRHYLTQTRRLPSGLVDQLHQAGALYATFSQERPQQTGACFVHRGLDDAARGVTIRNLGSGSGSFSIGDKLAAWFAIGDPVTARRAVLVEAPIDAISYAALKRPEETIILSVSGSHATRPVLDEARARRWQLAIGFDNDAPGEAGWKHCRESYAALFPNDPQPSRVLPVGKDWNDDLRVAPRQRHGRSV